jgi:hypothetical protein
MPMLKVVPCNGTTDPKQLHTGANKYANAEGGTMQRYD